MRDATAKVKGETVILKLDSMMLLMVTAGVGLLTLIVLLVCHRLNKTRHERRLNKILRNYRQDEIRSLLIPDGIGGFLELERLLLTDRGLLIIETFTMDGHLFAGEDIEKWTQIIDGRSFKFVNPLYHVENAKQALQLLAPKVPIFYRVVFTGKSDFPKGMPDQVSTLQSLEQDLQGILEAPKLSESSIKAWNTILSIGRKSRREIAAEVIS